MAQAVAVRLPREGVVRVVRALVASLTGREDPAPEAQRVFIVLGIAALTDIHQDFIRKARGQAGADGTRWPKLSRKTLAYSRRFGPGERARLKRDHGLGRGHRHAPGGKNGLLSGAQLRQWRGIYASNLKRLATQVPLDEAKRRAAQIAWAVMKRRGAKTNTGVLANSLQPGQITGGSYTAPPGEDQIFRLLRNGVIVGTNVPYARTHQLGLRGVPRRPIVPDNVPSRWVEGWARTAVGALAESLAQRLAQEGR